MRQARVVRRALFPLLVLCLAAPLTLAAGCRKSTDRTTSRAAARVVSLSPSTTETLDAIGALDRLVGRSRYCDYPPEVRKLPQVGGYVDPSLEAILGLRPDLVVGARGPMGAGLVDRLDHQGIATFFPPTESVAQVREMILALGERTGHATQAQAVVKALDARLAAVARAVSGKPRPRALLVFGLEPVVVAGPGGFPDEMLRLAGGENVVREGPAYPTIGFERVLALDPDVVLDAAMEEGHGQTRITTEAPGWRDVRAVRAGRVVAIQDESVLRPGPRLGQGVAVLARALHPDVAVFASDP
jgi:iron complex transport system substrate-binding protein